MNKKKSLIAVLTVVFLSLILGVLIVINPFKLNKLKGKVPTPANPAFDDMNFYSCIIDNYMSSGEEETLDYFESYDTYGGYPNSDIIEYNYDVPDEYLSKITNLDCYYKVKSVKGLEKLTNLEDLTLSSYLGKKLDLSGNKKLKSLTTYSSTYSEINLSENTELQELTITGSNLKNIDLSKNTKLNYLDVSRNNLSSIDTSMLTNLTYFNAQNNNISSIKFSPNLSINSSSFSNQANGFKNIDFGNGIKINIKTDDILIKGNTFIVKKELTVEDFMDSLELTNLTAKVCLNSSCSTVITEGNITTGYYVVLPELSNLSFSITEFYSSFFDNYELYSKVISEFNSANSKRYTTKNDLTEEELSTIKSLYYTSYTKPNSLKGIEKLTGLTSLNIDSGIYSELDFKTLTNLEELSLSNYHVSGIDLSTLTNLKELSISGGDLENIKLDNLTNLISLYLSNNKLKSLDISNNTNLQKIRVSYNELEELDTSNNPNLIYFEASNNKLKKLDFTNNLLITNEEQYYSRFDLSNNELTEIKALGNIKTTSFNLDYNQLTKLDFTGNTIVEDISANYNNIKTVKGLDEVENLKAIWLYGSPISKDTTYVIAGTTKMYEDKIKLHSNYSFDVYNEDDSIATYENDIVNGISSGQTTITKFSYASVYDELPYEIPLRLYIRVYDIKSNKYTINKEEKYIYVGTEDNDKAINRYVKVYGPDAKKKLSNNKFTILDDDKTVETYDVIKLSSTKYDLGKDDITYSKEFDIDNIKASNATVVLVGNQLQILHDDVIVKTFIVKDGK